MATFGWGGVEVCPDLEALADAIFHSICGDDRRRGSPQACNTFSGKVTQPKGVQGWLSSFQKQTKSAGS